jgi:hypothetical protein
VKPAAGLALTTDAAWASLVNVVSACNGRLRVKPGVVADSYLINKLTGVGTCMAGTNPRAHDSLSAAQVDLLRAWICQGALDN